MNMVLDTGVTSLKEILLALLNYTDTFSFVIREDQHVSNEAMDLLEHLKVYLIETKKVSEWPGTNLLWGKVTLYLYYLNNESAYILYTTEVNLYKWLLPDKPEDLTFYRNDRPFFVSITHEKDAYFDVDNDDRLFLESKKLI
ncbi:MAG: hypothetical protein JWR72_2343 [Flavisolibacter sp.]|jgi:hypothetical protein|nr:hypothetical protein [Flavisolibacter sp.]